MRKIHETEFCGWDERAEMLIIYELEEGEYEQLDGEYSDEHGSLDYDRLLADLGYYSEWGCIIPGARYTRFYVESLTVHHLVIARIDALNV